nr:MAG TPA: hypothetical protein [Caudoviricetes sp.]
MAEQILTGIFAGKEYDFLDADKNVLFTLRFNPSDINIVHRYNEAVEYLNTLDLPEISADNGMKEFSAAVKDVEDQLTIILDRLVNANIAEPIYSVMNPFSVLENGKFYIEEIIDSIGKIIEKEMGVRTAKVQSRIKKYTAKYNR